MAVSTQAPTPVVSIWSTRFHGPPDRLTEVGVPRPRSDSSWSCSSEISPERSKQVSICSSLSACLYRLEDVSGIFSRHKPAYRKGSFRTKVYSKFLGAFFPSGFNVKGVERGWLEGCHIIIACGNLFMNSAAKILLYFLCTWNVLQSFCKNLPIKLMQT